MVKQTGSVPAAVNNKCVRLAPIGKLTIDSGIFGKIRCLDADVIMDTPNGAVRKASAVYAGTLCG